MVKRASLFMIITLLSLLFHTPVGLSVSSTLFDGTYPASKEPLGWLTGWGYRMRLLLLPAECRGCYHPDFPVRIVLNYNRACEGISACVNLKGKSRPDFSDVIFTQADGVTPIMHVFERVIEGDMAVAWLRIPYDLSKGPAAIYIYFGISPYAFTSYSTPYESDYWCPFPSKEMCYLVNSTLLEFDRDRYRWYWSPREQREILPYLFPLANNTIIGAPRMYVAVGVYSYISIDTYLKHQTARGFGRLPLPRYIFEFISNDTLRVRFTGLAECGYAKWPTFDELRIIINASYDTSIHPPYITSLQTDAIKVIVPKELDHVELNVIFELEQWRIGHGAYNDPMSVFIGTEDYSFLPMLSFGFYFLHDEAYDYISDGYLKKWWHKSSIFTRYAASRRTRWHEASGIWFFDNTVRLFILGEYYGVERAHMFETSPSVQVYMFHPEYVLISGEPEPRLYEGWWIGSVVGLHKLSGSRRTVFSRGRYVVSEFVPSSRILEVTMRFSRKTKIVDIYFDNKRFTVPWPYEAEDIVAYIMGSVLEHTYNFGNLYYYNSTLRQMYYTSSVRIISFSIRGGPNPKVIVEKEEGYDDGEWIVLIFFSVFTQEVVRIPIVFRLQGNGIDMVFVPFPLSPTTVKASVFHISEDTPIFRIKTTGLFTVYDRVTVSFNGSLLDWFLKTYIGYYVRQGMYFIRVPRGTYNIIILSGVLHKIPVFTAWVSLSQSVVTVPIPATENAIVSCYDVREWRLGRWLQFDTSSCMRWRLVMPLFNWSAKTLPYVPGELLGMKNYMPPLDLMGKVQTMVYDLGYLFLEIGEGSAAVAVEPPNVRYIVRDFYGKPVPNATLALEVANETITVVVTDAQGTVVLSKDSNATLARYKPKPVLLHPPVPYIATNKSEGDWFTYFILLSNPTEISVVNYEVKNRTILVSGVVRETLFKTPIALAMVNITVHDLAEQKLLKVMKGSCNPQGSFSIEIKLETDVPYAQVTLTYPGRCTYLNVCLLPSSTSFMVSVITERKGLTPARETITTGPAPAPFPSPILFLLLLFILLLLVLYAVRRAIRESITAPAHRFVKFKG